MKATAAAHKAKCSVILGHGSERDGKQQIKMIILHEGSTSVDPGRVMLHLCVGQVAFVLCVVVIKATKTLNRLRRVQVHKPF